MAIEQIRNRDDKLGQTSQGRRGVVCTRAEHRSADPMVTERSSQVHGPLTRDLSTSRQIRLPLPGRSAGASATIDLPHAPNGPSQAHPPLAPLEMLRTSTDRSELEVASQWLENNFEPWMLHTFGHRLYEHGAEFIMRGPAAFLSTREDIDVEERLTAALIASSVEPAQQEDKDQRTDGNVWMSALRGAMRAEVRKAIVRVPKPGCDNILKFWNRLSEPDRRWAVGRLGALDLHRRCELLYLGAIDDSEAVVIEALSAIERAANVGSCGKIRTALERLKSHPSVHVRARTTRSPLIQYQWPNALRVEENPRVQRLLIRRAFEDLSGRALYPCLRHADVMEANTIDTILYHASLEADVSSEDLRFLRQHPLVTVRAAAARFFP